MRKILETLGIKEVNNGVTTGGSKSWSTTEAKELVSYSPDDGKPIIKINYSKRINKIDSRK